MSKRILVNGAGGFIGGNVVRRLLARGYRVRASDQPGVDLSWAAQAGAETAAASLLDAKAIARSLRGVDVVVHAAAIFDLTTPAETIIRVNTQGTHNYCRAAVNQGVQRLIQFSTVGVYGVPNRRAIAESGRKRPRNPYEASKWQSEQIAMSYAGQNGLRVAALRPTLVYGPGSRYGQAIYLTLFACLAAWGVKRLPVPAGGRLTHHIHVDDVAAAVEALIEANVSAYGRAYNVADSLPLNSQQVLDLLSRQMGFELNLLPAALNSVLAPSFRWGQPWLVKYLANLNRRMQNTWKAFGERGWVQPALTPKFDQGWLDYLWADHSFSTKALQHLGWRPSVPSFLQGLPPTIAWYRQQRWLPTVQQLQAFAQELRQKRRQHKGA